MKDKLKRINNVKRIDLMSKQSEYWPITKTGQVKAPLISLNNLSKIKIIVKYRNGNNYACVLTSYTSHLQAKNQHNPSSRLNVVNLQTHGHFYIVLYYTVLR